MSALLRHARRGSRARGLRGLAASLRKLAPRRAGPGPCLALALPGVFALGVSGAAIGAPATGAHPGAGPVESELLAFASGVSEVFARATIEGHAVSSYRFHAHGNPEQVLRAAQDTWARRAILETVKARSGPWRILSARDRDGFITLQVQPRPGGGATGLLSVWRQPQAAQAHKGSSPPPPQPGAAPGFPSSAAAGAASFLPPGSVVLRTLGTADAGRRGETVVAVAASGRAWVADAIRASARAAGFSPDRPGASRSNGQAMFFRRDASELAVTLVDGEGGTAIVLHHYEALQ
ncbi:MAG TPA: hypothetical protein VIT02_14845 [Burkholderiaceae bacterium]